MSLTVDQICDIVAEAQTAAYAAADRFFQEKLGGRDQYACGFAATRIYRYQGKEIKGNTRIGRAMKAAGIRQNYERTFEIWSPAKYPVQNVDVHEAGAQAAAEVFKKHGFEAVAWARLD